MTLADPANDGAELYPAGREPCLVCSYYYPTNPDGSLVAHLEFSSSLPKPCPGSNTSWKIP
jgi:hypothetical protein